MRGPVQGRPRELQTEKKRDREEYIVTDLRKSTKPIGAPGTSLLLTCLCPENTVLEENNGHLQGASSVDPGQASANSEHGSQRRKRPASRAAAASHAHGVSEACQGG